MKILFAKDYDEMSRKAANIIASQITMKHNSVLGLATGSSPIGTYKELIKKYEQGDLCFDGCYTANLDEYRGLTKDNDQSYAYFMYNNLFKYVNINMDKTNIPDGSNPDAEAECKRYDKVVEDLGGVDIQLLGIGHDGHIGFNEPDDSFPVGTHCVKLTDMTIEANKRFFARKEDVPTEAYTMGIGTIMKAKKNLMVASGKDKAEILYKTACGEVKPDVPASILRLHADVTIVADEAALSMIIEKAPELVIGLPKK